MLLTVAVCTWNRAASLARALASFRGLRVPAGCDWELIVVDNNSADDTRGVLESYAGSLPLVALSEPTQGHSHARNRAAAAANGELVVWTDDDVTVPANWLEEYAAAAAAFPTAAFFGGPIRPAFPPGTPPSLVKHLPAVGPAFAARDFGPGVRWFEAHEHPFGANLAIRQTVQAGIRYHPRLGRVGSGLVGADETAILTALAARGRRGVWVGTAGVDHHIPADRAGWDYVWRYYAGVGQTAVRLDGLPAAATLFGRPRWLVAKAAECRVKSIIKRWAGRPGWVHDYTWAAQYAGYFAELATRRGRAQYPGFLVPPLAEIDDPTRTPPPARTPAGAQS